MSHLQIAVALDLSNYRMSNMHMHAALTQFSARDLAVRDASLLMERLLRGDISRKVYNSLLLDLLHSTGIVATFSSAVRSDLLDTRNLIGKHFPGLHKKQVRLIIVDEYPGSRASYDLDLDNTLQVWVDKKLLDQRDVDVWRRNIPPTPSKTPLPLTLHNTLRGVLMDAFNVVVRTMRFSYIKIKNVKADEAIAVLARQLQHSNEHLCIASNDTDFFQLKRYGISQVSLRDDFVDGYQYTSLPTKEADERFLFQCALLGKGRMCNLVGSTFGRVPLGIHYPDAVGTIVIGDHIAPQGYTDAFQAFDANVRDIQPWNWDMYAILLWLDSFKVQVPDIRVRFLANVMHNNINPYHPLSHMNSVTRDSITTPVWYAAKSK